MSKKNDFIVASINNPTFSPADFKDILDMNIKNTLMLSEDLYLNSKFIKENPLFLDANGNFIKDKFTTFYRLKLKDFSEFSTESALDNYQYGLFDTFRKAQDKILPFGMWFEEVHNPERVSTGVVGPNLLGERTMSDRELALREKVFDYNKGEFRDYTPNDLAFTKNPFAWIGSLFHDPLVLATYDENGTHYDPILGREVEHYKGQKKLNANGVPYYETLAGRSAANKDILSVTDNLTIDGSWLNKYDFFDSDSLDKSIPGVVMKNIAVLAPMFITGAGEYYAGALVVRELAKTLPMLYGMAGLFSNDIPDSKFVNTIGSIGQKFTGGTSDYAKEKMFSMENFGSLISDVALQWGQLQWVINNLTKINKATKATEEAAKAKALAEYNKQASVLLTLAERGEIATSRVKELTGATNREELAKLMDGDGWMTSIYGGASLEKYLTPAKDIIARKTKLAQDMSLGYMAIISNGDVYLDALDHGASKREAAMLALGSTVGMFSVDKYLGLGEMFYDPAQRAERLLYRNTVLDNTKKITQQLKEVTPEVTAATKAVTKEEERKGLGKLFTAGIRAGRKAVTDYQSAIKEGTLGFFGKALGEGLEEVSEELVTDIVKLLGEIAGQYGAGPSDLGAWNNMKDRYLMSFLGGAIGGGIFSLKDGNFKARQASGELLLLLRLGKGQQIRDELDRLHKDGQLGDTNLSYKTEETIDDDGTVHSVFLTADENNESQNDYAYRVLTLSIELIETILQKNHLVKTENELFESLVLLDENYTALRDYLEDRSYITGYLRRYQQLTKNIVAQELKIAQMSKSDGEKKANDLEILRAKEDLNNMLLERDRFFNGDYSLEYLLKMLFAINPLLAGAFMPITKHLFTRSIFHANYDYLDKGTLKVIDRLYEQLVKDPSKMEEELDKSFKKFQELQPNMEKILSEHLGGSKEWENIRKMLKEDGILKPEDVYEYDSILPGEDEESESYVNRNTLLEDESMKDFVDRRTSRIKTVAELNARQKINKLLALLDSAGTFDYIEGRMQPASFIDPSTKRYLLAYLGETQKHIKNRLLAGLAGIGIDRLLLNNAENYDELYNTVKDALLRRYEEEMSDKFLSLLGTLDFEGLNTFYALLTDLSSFKLEDVLKNLNRDGWEDYTIPELLAAMFEDYTGVLGEFDFILDAERYNELYNLYMAETDPEKEAELKELLDELGQKEYDVWNLEYFDLQVKASVENEMNRLEKTLKDINSAFESDPELKVAKDLEEKLSIEENPAVKLVKLLAPSIGSEAVEVEKALESIFKLFLESEKSTDFLLSIDQENYLEEAKYLIGIVRAMVAASSRESNLQDGMTYNKAVNSFYEKHKNLLTKSEFFKNFEPLFEMDERIGGLLIMALDGYIDEINSWIDLSRANRANSARSLQNAEQALRNARLKFMSVSMKSHELLADSIVNENSPYALFHFEKQFHDNVLKAISKGRTLEDILQDLAAHIGQDELLVSGITSNIDETLQDLTAYDKFMYLVSLIGIDPQKLLELERDFIKANPKIAPLATLLPAMQLGKALEVDPKIINTALDVLKEIAKRNGYDIPVLYNTTIVTGIGGGGKTSVEAKYLIKEDEDTWIAGPTDKLVETLSEVAPKATAFSIEALLKKILGDDLGIKVYNEDSSIKESKNLKGLDNQSTLLLKGIEESAYIVTGAPKHLVIDEATHVGNLALLAIGQWARKAGVRVTMLGDENQRGKESNAGRTTVSNLARETLIAFRTPRLNFSLRNESIWKVLNLNKIVSLLDKARNSNHETTEAIFNEILGVLKNKLELSYFENETTLEGEKVVSELRAEDLAKFTGSVAYIGGSKERIDFILKNLGPGATFEVFNKDLVQGREFDHVIIDTDWDGMLNSLPDGRRKYETGLSNSVELLRSLYTMISRSRKGSLIINNLLTEVVKPIREEYTTKYERLSDEVIARFIKDRLDYIEGLLASIAKPEEKPTEEAPEEKKEPELTLEDTPKENIADDKKDELEHEETLPFESHVTGYRAYGNVQFQGNVTSDEHNRWIPIGGVVRDLGLFSPLADGIIAHNGAEKRAVVADLNYLKSLFLYNLDLNLYDIPTRLQGVVTIDQLKAAKFFLVSEDKTDVHKLIGQTTLHEGEQDFIPGKVISIQARFDTAKGPAILTLGAVADPQTWRDGINNNPSLSEDEKEQLRAEANHYETLLKNLVNSESLEIQINRPTFNGRTELIKLTKGDFGELKDGERAKDRRKIRLEGLWDATSEWDARTGNSVVSPIHILTSEIPGIDPSLVGHAVIFVSNNGTLSPERLGSIYLQLQRDRAAGRESAAQVRMIVLDNSGVSFHSVYRNGFSDIYKTSYKDSEFAFPYDLQPMGIRMLASLWNYRADLIRFINALNLLKTDKGISLTLLIQMAKDESELYRLLLELRKKEYEEAHNEVLEKLPVISNAEYKRWLDTESSLDSTKVANAKAIMEFNESLDIPRFRIGWSDRTGSTIRRIVGLKNDNPYYRDKFLEGTYTPDTINGIFINPDLAYQYNEMMDDLFSNVIDKIFDTTSLNKTERINYKEVEDWVNNVREGKLIIDHEGHLIPVPPEDKVKAIPLLLAKIAQNMHYKMHFGEEIFMDRYNKEKDPYFHIQVNKGDKDTELDYIHLDEHLVTNIGGREVRGLVLESTTRLDIIGLNEFTYETGDTTYQDCRIDNFFNLIFHGVAFEKNYNEFEDGQLVATDALFKYGFFIDPMLIKVGGTAEDMIAPCSTNRALFKTDVVPGNPIIEFTFDKVREETGPVIAEETQVLPVLGELQRFDIDTSSWNLDDLSEDEVLAFILNKANAKNKLYFAKGEVAPEKVIVEVLRDNVKTLKDLLSENNVKDIIETTPSGDGTSVQFKDSNGKIVEVIFNDGTININDKTEPGNRNAGENSNAPAVFMGEEITKAISDYISNHDQFEDSDLLQAWLEGKEGVEYSKDDLEAIKIELRQTLNDEGILDLSDIEALENIIDMFINQINTTDCVK